MQRSRYSWLFPLLLLLPLLASLAFGALPVASLAAPVSEAIPGTLYTWGANTYGQLGDGLNIDSNIPVQINGPGDVIAVAASNEHSLALKADGTVWAWGSNFSGQLGNGTNNDSNIPVQVQGLTDMVAIAAGTG